ncbi:baseplate hub protein [Singulisphaera sp. PoT]|uniref:baseplate hub protein n=1 Tax=Singulisphaera sp. PoT TaxID=3411797 RepID=UPI003BF48676
MTAAFDPRIVRVGFDLPSGHVDLEGLAIYASGRKYASGIQAECTCRVFNLTRERQNSILTTASPLLKQGQERTPINMTLDVGRESYGTFRLFEGYVFQGGMTQPPDIGILLRSLTNNLLTGVIAGASQPRTALLSVIARSVAQANGLTLSFQAADKQINNWSVSGSAQQQINRLGQVGGVDAFVDNSTLVVIDSGKARDGDSVLINAQTGMVGIPQVTDIGVAVRVMINNAIQVGGSVTIESELNPAANGTFKVIQLNFEVASRDQPFWYTLVCSNLAFYQGSQ